MKKHEEKALNVVRRLQEAGHTAYFAGGAVRDRLLGQTPEDVDVATSASPEEVLGLFDRCEQVGRSFGVVLVKSDTKAIEVASFRLDGPYTDGRRPEWVRPATAEEDAGRRDFSVNGMFYDPIADKLIDHVGGLKDLEAGLIRAIGDPAQRFREDYLRMFRAVRFSLRLNFNIEDETWKQLKLLSGKVEGLAAERVLDELTRILCAARAGRAIELLTQAGLLDHWLPEVRSLCGVKQEPEHHPEGDVFTHTCLLLDQLDEPSAALAWGALLHDIGKPATTSIAEGRIRSLGHAKLGAEMVTTIAERLRFSRSLRDSVCELVERHMRFIEYPRMRISTRKRLRAREGFGDLLELHRADCLASHGRLDNYNMALADLNAEAKQPRLPEPLISGRDLKKLGLKPSPLFAEILRKVQDLQLEGELKDREGALEYVREMWGGVEIDPETSSG